RLGIKDLRPDVQVQPVELQFLACADASDGLAGLIEGQPELGVGASGGLRLVGFRRDPGDDPDQHPLRAGSRCSSRSMSSKLSTTTVATPASSAMVSSAAVLALPCRYIRSGRTPAARAMTSSPAPATSMLSPAAANSL